MTRRPREKGALMCRLGFSTGIIPVVVMAAAGILSGCGGGATDPFERIDVTGTVTLDGQPLKYGEIYFKGERLNPDAPDVPQAQLPIRDGKFNSTRAYKPGRGKNTVTVTAYDGDPPPQSAGDDTDIPEPKVLGYWQTEITLADKNPLSFAISKSELQQQPPQ
jgi:hypothetical protein